MPALMLGLAALTVPALAAPAEPGSGQPQGEATLTIHVQRVSAKGGVLRLGLYDAGHYDRDSDPTAFADVPAQMGETVVTLKHIPPGTYAIEAFQDVNGNGHMDTNWLGLPLEPYGFSRDAKPFLSKPGFAAVRFALQAGENSQTLHLQNSNPVMAEGTAPRRRAD